eukprot:scaffold668_cov385-Prasinococcus_capsulatus_cf.AAC.15
MKFVHVVAVLSVILPLVSGNIQPAGHPQLVKGQRSRQVVAEQAVEGLIARVLGPEYPGNFSLNAGLSPIGEDSLDAFRISGGGSGRQVLLEGTSGVALASALGWYLKYYCHVEISWCVITSSKPTVHELGGLWWRS